MKKTEVFVLLTFHLLAFIQLSYNYETVASTYVKCKLDDSKCLTTQAQNTLQLFVKGIPELGIKSIEKLYLEPVKVKVPELNFTWSDITVEGLANSIIDDVSIDMNYKIMRVLFHTTLKMDFHYVANGVVLSAVPFYGDGQGEVFLNKIQYEMLIVFDINKDTNGRDFMDLKTYYYSANPIEGVSYKFGNSYGGDKEKGEGHANFVNKYWRTITSNFSGFFNKKITDILYSVMDEYMGALPLEEVAIYKE